MKYKIQCLKCKNKFDIDQKERYSGRLKCKCGNTHFKLISAEGFSYFGYCKICGVEYGGYSEHTCSILKCSSCGYQGPKVYEKKLEGFHFRYTEPDYGDGYECPNCHKVIAGSSGKEVSNLFPIYSKLIFKCPKCGYEGEEGTT